jgi:hypothetical protein
MQIIVLVLNRIRVSLAKVGGGLVGLRGDGVKYRQSGPDRIFEAEHDTDTHFGVCMSFVDFDINFEVVAIRT